jgi:DNA polymerase-1
MFPERFGFSPKNVERLDMNAMPIIMRMARRGLQVDISHFQRMEVELTRDMQKCCEDIRTLTGYYINPGSGDQVAELLFRKLGLKQARRKMTPTEARESVEDEVLKAIQHQHPVVGVIQDYKEYEKLRGTYVIPIPKLARRVGTMWRLFPNFRTTRVPSGRLACADPNLLAMPNRTSRGRDIRRGFITDSGWVYLSIDLSQIEVRVAAHRSRDESLCSVYLNGEDVYSDFATSAFKITDRRFKDDSGWHYPGVDKQAHRFPAKTCVLASIYDVTAGGLQAQMPVVCSSCNKPAVCPLCGQGKEHVCTKHDCHNFKPLWTENKCQTVIDAFYRKYPGLLRMRMADHAYMRSNEYIVDDFGRLQHIQAVRSVHERVVTGALREGSNTPIQGTAQAIFKLAITAVDSDLEVSGLYGEKVNPVLPVHDELVMEVREESVEEVAELCKYRFQTPCKLTVPIGAEWSTGESWGAIQK